MVLHHYQLVSCFQQWVETSEPVLRVLFQKIRWYAKQLVSVLYLTYHVFLIKQPIVTIYRNEQLGVCFVRSQDIAKYQLFCDWLYMVCSSLYLSYSVNHTLFFVYRSSCEAAQEISMEELAELIPIKSGMVQCPLKYLCFCSSCIFISSSFPNRNVEDEFLNIQNAQSCEHMPLAYKSII